MEIYFSGKRADNGKWITGSETYIRDGDGIWLADEDLHVVQVIDKTVRIEYLSTEGDTVGD